MNDKALHFLAGALVASVAVLLFHAPPEVSTIAALVAGVGKEVYDRLTGRGHVEVADVLVTWIGGIVAAMVLAGFGVV